MVILRLDEGQTDSERNEALFNDAKDLQNKSQLIKDIILLYYHLLYRTNDDTVPHRHKDDIYYLCGTVLCVYSLSFRRKCDTLLSVHSDAKQQ